MRLAEWAVWTEPQTWAGPDLLHVKHRCGWTNTFRLDARHSLAWLAEHAEGCQR